MKGYPQLYIYDLNSDKDLKSMEVEINNVYYIA